MNLTLRLTLSFLIVICLAGLSMAHTADDLLKIADFVNNPDDITGPTIKSTIVVAPATTDTQRSFSVTQFMKSATEPTMVGDTSAFEFASFEKSRKSLEATSSKTITFIPSRGPKLPWQSGN